jgi:glycosyltransferase involved in cell wall biosynthesis
MPHERGRVRMRRSARLRPRSTLSPWLSLCLRFQNRRRRPIANLPASFFGNAPAPCRGCLAVFDSSERAVNSLAPPSSFRVLAIVPTYNEEDVIAQTLGYLIGQGIEVYLLDSWSTDGTVEHARAFAGAGLVGLERFPPKGPTATYDLTALLRRVEEIAANENWADWVMLHDADERRRSPWPGVPLRTALWRVDQSGFSCVDHVTLNFCPVDDGFDPHCCELEQYFSYFEFSSHPGHFHQRRAWKRLGVPVALADSAGHDVRFAARRVYPYKFLLKHYPVRSRAHGERKVRHERVARWNLEERARGWHRQYDDSAEIFLRRAEDLIRFDDHTFWERYLVERLSGAGIFSRPPDWATAPRW